MSAKDNEQHLINRCMAVVDDPSETPANAREANVMALAGSLVESDDSAASERLRAASDRYFEDKPTERVVPAQMVRQGWLIGVPRFHKRVVRALRRRG